MDLFVANGRVKRDGGLLPSPLPLPWASLAEPNLFYLNEWTGEGVKFRLAGPQTATHTPGPKDQVPPQVITIADRYDSFLLGLCGPMCDRVEVSRGVAMGDLGSDGRLDLVVTNVAGPSRIYRNQAPSNGAWLLVRAVDPRFRRDAIGARVIVTAGGKQFHRTISPAASYLSSSDSRAHFGLGEVASIERLDLYWPDGLHEVFSGVPLNSSVTLTRGTGVKP